MKISELLLENTDKKHHKHKKPASNLPSAASIDDESQDEFDDREDDDLDRDDEDNESKQQEAIDEFKANAKDLGEGMWVIALYPDKSSKIKEYAINNLLEAFPEFDYIDASLEELIVAVFKEDGPEIEFIVASPYEDNRRTSEQFEHLTKFQNRIIGHLYKTISRWSRDPDSYNTHNLKLALG